MANIRQYVGARYVTKIYENSLDSSSAEWESNVTYEPLTMVTYNNSSYLSKKDVPANIGNPAQNPTYWVVTGAYNGQISSLQAQIDVINNTTIPNVIADMGSLTDLDTDDKTSLVNAINELENAQGINSIKGKVIAFYGDSYGISPHSAWLTELANYTGATIYNHSVSGGTSAHVLSSVTGNAHADADICIFEYGINDWLTQLSIANECANTYNIIKTLKTNSPNAQIFGITMPAGVRDNNSDEHSLQIPREIYRQIMAQICNAHGCGVIASQKFTNCEFLDNQHFTESYFTNYYWKDVVKSIEKGGDSNVFLNDYGTDTYTIYIYEGDAYLFLNGTALTSSTTRLINTLDIVPLARHYGAMYGKVGGVDTVVTVQSLNSDIALITESSANVWGDIPITYINNALLNRIS